MHHHHHRSFSSSQTRRPLLWQDDMAEIKETFRRVALVKPAVFSSSSSSNSSPPRRSAPALSHNRRARIRSQVPSHSRSLPVPPKILQEIQRNRSQSPFVSLNHLQNVLCMCRRIRSQKSLTERKKNPHDAGVYPVFVRRPASVHACMQEHHREHWQRGATGAPNPDLTPISYKPARFKPLYDISNGLFLSSDVRKRLSSRASGSSDHSRTSAPQKPSWNHSNQAIDHPPVPAGDSSKIRSSPPTSYSWDFPDPENLIITKKARLKSSSVVFREEWPSSNSSLNLRNTPGSVSLSDLPSPDHSRRVGCGQDFTILSDRRPHSEGDLNLHSTSYFLERPPSRCMKRPLSSCCWRNGGLQLAPRELLYGEKTNPSVFTDSWSAYSSSSQEDHIFIPRDLNGNVLRDAAMNRGDLHRSFAMNSAHAPKDTAPCSKIHMQKSVQRKVPVQGSSHKKRNEVRGSREKDLFVNTLDQLEGLPPTKWAKRLALDLIVCPRKGMPECKEKFVQSGVPKQPKHRVKFASPAADRDDRMAAQKPRDVLSEWERFNGLSMSDPPISIDRNDGEVLARKEDGLFRAQEACNGAGTAIPMEFSSAETVESDELTSKDVCKQAKETLEDHTNSGEDHSSDRGGIQRDSKFSEKQSSNGSSIIADKNNDITISEADSSQESTEVEDVGEEGLDQAASIKEEDDDFDDNAESELEKLFRESLDLNPTLRHLYDTMNDLGKALKQTIS